MNALQSNGRIEQAGGMRFYEQDVVMLSYLYTGDAAVRLDVEYHMPGFGLVVSAYSSWSGRPDEASRVMVAKVGNLEFSAYERTPAGQECLHHAASTIAPDGKVHHLRFVKTGLYLYLYEETEDGETMLGRCGIPNGYDRFYIGVYSNAGNVVQDMHIYDSRPHVWSTNIANTNGGRIAFSQNGFRVENAENAIEVIHENIPLRKGRYFLDYDILPVNGRKRVEVYLFPSTEPKIKAHEKNLLQTDASLGNKPYLNVEKDMRVTALFEVYSGEVSHVALKSDPKQEFVPTDGETSGRAGSFLQANLNNLSLLKWSGTIEKVPYAPLDEAPRYCVLAYGSRRLTLEAAAIQVGFRYEFELRRRGGIWSFTITDSGRQVHYSSYPAGEPFARIFENVSGTIDQVAVIDSKGHEKNVMYQRTVRKFVPVAIESPVIITDDDGIPFDISASYRRLPDGRFFFTNWERDVFEPSRTLQLEKELRGSTDIILYGLRDKGNMDKLYDVPSESGVNSIDAVTGEYDCITSDNYNIVRDNQIVLADELDKSQYKAFIVDYMKNDSYAINLSEDGDTYELDISTEKEHTSTYYDISGDGQIRTYKALDEIVPADNAYIILRRNEVIP